MTWLFVQDRFFTIIQTWPSSHAQLAKLGSQCFMMKMCSHHLFAHGGGEFYQKQKFNCVYLFPVLMVLRLQWITQEHPSGNFSDQAWMA